MSATALETYESSRAIKTHGDGDSDLAIHHGQRMVKKIYSLNGEARAGVINSFDPLSQAMASDDWITFAISAWNIQKVGILYNACKKFTLERVRDTIREIDEMREVSNKGGYLTECLKRMN